VQQRPREAKRRTPKERRAKTKAAEEAEADTGHLATIRAILTTIIIVTMKAIIRTTEAAEEVEVEAEAEAADEDPAAVEDEDIRASTLIQTITTEIITITTIKTLMRKERIRIIINNRYHLHLRIGNNNNSRSSNSSSSKVIISMVISTAITIETIISINAIRVGEMKQKYMSVIPH
jgi:hypothetical protein